MCGASPGPQRCIRNASAQGDLIDGSDSAAGAWSRCRSKRRNRYRAGSIRRRRWRISPQRMRRGCLKPTAEPKAPRFRVSRRCPWPVEDQGISCGLSLCWQAEPCWWRAARQWRKRQPTPPALPDPRSRSCVYVRPTDDLSGCGEAAHVADDFGQDGVPVASMPGYQGL